MLNTIINNYFTKAPIETLVNITESNSPIINRISNIYQNIKLFFLNFFSTSKEKFDSYEMFEIESPELLPPPLLHTLSSTIAENPTNINRVKKFSPDQISAQEWKIFIKELETFTLKEMPKSNIVEEIIQKNKIVNATLRRFDTNLTPLTPLTPQENPLEKELNKSSLVDWKNAKGPLSVAEVAIKVNRELREVEIKAKRKVQEVAINGRKEVQEIREKKIKAKREAEEAAIKAKRE